jgi:hypothetical protein
MNDESAKLHRFIVEHYSLEDFRTLCFDLGVRYDSLGGDTIDAKSRELLLHMRHQERLADLLAMLKKDRPESFAQAGLSEDPALLREALVEVSSASPSDVCLYDYDNPPYNNVEMHYLGEKVIKDVRVWQIYLDKDGKEQRVQIEQFFSEQDLGMWGRHVQVNVMRKNSVVRFHLIGKKTALENKAVVEVVFTDARTGETLVKQQEFELKK